MSTAFVFPGQGSQKVGMGRAWADQSDLAREVFAEADEVLGFSLSKLCWEGPEGELKLTENTQPAILATSIAIYRAVTDRLETPTVMAGHSLGEYSALVAAGTLSLADALQLVRSRGRFMQEAVPSGEGAMAAILGLDSEAVERIAATATSAEHVCAVANFNSPEQTVVSGSAAAVDRAVSLASEQGALRAVLLPVSAPFHSPLMRPARQRLEPLLEATAFDAPRVPVVANVDARPVDSGETACKRLVQQVDSPVRWVDSVRTMVTRFGVERFIEIGPGAVLSGLGRRIARGTFPPEPGGAREFRQTLGGGGIGLTLSRIVYCEAAVSREQGIDSAVLSSLQSARRTSLAPASGSRNLQPPDCGDAAASSIESDVKSALFPRAQWAWHRAFANA